MKNTDMRRGLLILVYQSAVKNISEKSENWLLPRWNVDNVQFRIQFPEWNSEKRKCAAALHVLLFRYTDVELLWQTCRGGVVNVSKQQFPSVVVVVNLSTIEGAIVLVLRNLYSVWEDVLNYKHGRYLQVLLFNSLSTLSLSYLHLLHESVKKTSRM